jgi:methionine-rich copper-binding protein CopC
MAIAVACMGASAADAAPRMVGSTPAAGQVVKTAPASIRVNFSEPVAEAATGAALASDTGQPMQTGAPKLNGNNVRQIVVPITSKLEAGTYTVVWHAVGRDGMRVTGTFQFELKP